MQNCLVMKKIIFLCITCFFIVVMAIAQSGINGPHKDPDRNEVWRMEYSCDYHKSYICPQGYDSCKGEITIMTGPTPYTYDKRYKRLAQEVTQDSIYDGVLHAYYYYDKSIIFLFDTASIKRHSEMNEPIVVQTVNGRAALSAKYISLIGFDDGLIHIRYKGLLFMKKMVQ